MKFFKWLPALVCLASPLASQYVHLLVIMAAVGFGAVTLYGYLLYQVQFSK